MPIPVLTYHSMRIDGNAYAENDVVALASDLRTISMTGRRIEPLARIVDALLEGDQAFFWQPVVGLSCDDGPDFDFHDLVHPSAGSQRSVLNVIEDGAAQLPEVKPHITSFVIVSPDARAELDRSCMIGRGWWNDSWWASAVASGCMHIGNHSWDHNHDALPNRFDRGVRRGTFKTIDRKDLADHQIDQAAAYLQRHAPNPGAALFAYPYGESNPYLLNEYFEQVGERIGVRAAFGDGAQPITPSSPRWNLPRYVFGRDWTSPEMLRDLLHASG